MSRPASGWRRRSRMSTKCKFLWSRGQCLLDAKVIFSDQCISDASAYVSRLRRLPATDGVTARIVSEEMNIRVMERKKFLHSPQKLREAVLLNELQENYQRWPAHVARSIETITADYGEGAPYLFDLARNYCIVYRGGELVAAAKNTSVFLERHGDDEGYFFEDGFDEQHKKATVSVDAYNTKQFRTIQSFKAPGDVYIVPVMSLFDTGAADPSILPMHLRRLDPNQALNPIAFRNYSTAGGGQTTDPIYSLLVALYDDNVTNTVISWKRMDVGIEANDLEVPLSGCFGVLGGYIATNPGDQEANLPPQLHIGSMKTETLKLAVARQTGWL
ncbi:hypothetical protein BDD12DRAFT_909647 [Trichophaea hybrida]|nr:hypothetical protein BDD12DRAFT_909647 [Trichophaea hybrida]